MDQARIVGAARCLDGLTRTPIHGSIYVRWHGGPEQKAIETVAMPFQGGHFDGMDDSYKTARSAWCEAFGGAQYVVCRREP